MLSHFVYACIRESGSERSGAFFGPLLAGLPRGLLLQQQQQQQPSTVWLVIASAYVADNPWRGSATWVGAD